MKYLGGKSKTANQIAAYLNQIRQPNQPYWEPFVGAGWILERIKGQPIYASDANPHLIELWRAVQSGWMPPELVTEDDYRQAMAGEFTNAMTAFIGFGCSYGGKWFAGYARNEKGVSDPTIARTAKNSLLHKSNRTENGVHYFYANFLECYVPAYGCLIYCDPPYEGTTGYGAVGQFDSGAFWERVRWLENHGHTVVVSEYNAPDDFSCVLEMPTKTDMHTKDGKAPHIEKLFRLGEHPKFQGTLW